MVTASENNLGACVDQPGQRVGEHTHGVRGRQRPVVDIARHEDGLDPLRADQIDEEFDELHLGTKQPHLVERAPQVPVGGVNDAHPARL